ncbi:MAG: 30S ribosomal protein THX [Saprospiraceae bacterium]
MGRGDKRSNKGKRTIGSYGNTRTHKGKKANTPPVATANSTKSKA